MNILVELDSSDVKIGAVNDVLDLVRYLKQFPVKFYISGPLNDELINKAKLLGAEVIHFRSREMSKRHIFSYLLNAARWFFIIKKIRPAVVHLNYVSWGPSLGFVANLCRIPVVARAGGDYNSKNLTHKWVDKYLANCAQQADRLLKSVLAEKVAIVGDLIDIGRFKSVNKPSEPYPPKITGRVRFLFLGQLVERKGIDFLVEAFNKVSLNSDLLLVGGDWSSAGFPSRVKQTIDNYQLSDRIHCLNHRDDAMSLMNDCDVFVLPSLSEARPRSIIEAMLMGKCVLATDVGGIPTLITDKKTGLLVRPGDSDALGRAMDLLISDDQLRLDISSRAKEYASNTFDPVKTAEKYLEVYENVIENKSKG